MSKRAIIQVENTEKVIDLAKYLVNSGWEILSGGKTGEFLQKEEIPFTTVNILSEPKYNPHEVANFIQNIINTDEHGLDGNDIYLVCINIHPTLTAKKTDFLVSSTIGSTIFFHSVILRDAFANYTNIIILTDPEDYKEAIIQLRTDNVSEDFKQYLAAKALNMLSAFDSALSANILANSKYGEPFMNYLMLPLKRQVILKGGSNPQQKSCLYNFSYDDGALSGFKKLQGQGQELSYNIISDLSLAWDQISTIYHYLKNQLTVKSINCDGYEFTTQFTPLTGTVFTVAVKLNCIIGAGLSTNVLDSFKKAYTYDAESISNAVLGCSAVIDKLAAEEIIQHDFSAIIAPGFTDEAKEIFATNNNIHLIPTAKVFVSNFDIQIINGGMLFQTTDSVLFEKWNVKTKIRPSQKQSDEMALGMLLAMNSRSFSTILLRGNSIVGISQACSSQIKALRNVLLDAKEFAKRNGTENETLGDLLVCDSSIPFCDEVRELIDKGVSSIIQTGGTPMDSEFIKFCDERGIVMVFTDLTHISL